MTYKNNLKQVSSTAIIFCLPIVFFLIVLLTLYSKSNGLPWADAISKSAVFACIVWVLTIPGLILHCNYYNYEKGRTINFDTNFLELIDHSKVTKIYHDEIKEVKQFYLAWNNKNPWNHYGYTKLLSKTGKSVIITNLLKDQKLIKEYFINNSIPFDEIGELYTWVK